VSLAERRIAWLLPGSLQVMTGGTNYDREIVAGLRSAGWQVDVASLSERFPWPDADALDDAAHTVAGLPDGMCVVVDGLAFGALPALAHAHARRLRWIALVHHPLALEAGLTTAQRAALQAGECEALRAAHAVITTSPATARTLQADYGVANSQLHVVLPGTDAAPLARGSQDGPAPGPLSLLCVATLTPRKGHALLIEALAGLRERHWVLHCVGSATRDPATAHAIQHAIKQQGVAQHVFLHGEIDAVALHARYMQADAFILPSLHEGYGMALAEALSYGLPVISTTAGAIPETVPTDAGALVPPGDVVALRIALARLCSEPDWRAQRAAGARDVRARLPSWSTARAEFAAALHGAMQSSFHKAAP
jgi:glycosyltransferase involved in cell wall biosynthesis